VVAPIPQQIKPSFLNQVVANRRGDEAMLFTYKHIGLVHQLLACSQTDGGALVFPVSHSG
jgi:hypothetical protein